MPSEDQSDRLTARSGQPERSISSSLDDADDEVARAYAAALSVSKMSATDRVEVRTLQDEQQRALLEKHHRAALAKAQWEEQLHHPELMLQASLQKIKQSPLEFEAAWRGKTKEMQHKLEKFSHALKIPGVQLSSSSSSLVKESSLTDVAAGSTSPQIESCQSPSKTTAALRTGNQDLELFTVMPFGNESENETKTNSAEETSSGGAATDPPLITRSRTSSNATQSSMAISNATKHMTSVPSAVEAPSNESPTSSILGPLQQLHPQHSTRNHSPTQALSAAEPTLSMTVWKRRDGLAKFATKNSWERRRLVLQDTKLFYFAEQGTTEAHLSPTSTPATTTAISTALTFPTWLEQAAAVLSTIDLATSTGTTNGAESPRGCIDLIKENASVVPSTSLTIITGQTIGYPAPTPFCLSVKVDDKTKWKLCFDTHQHQMQWLVAVSNVIIRYSIEEYVLDQSKSADGVKVNFTIQEDYFVLKDRNEIVDSDAGGVDASTSTADETPAVNNEVDDGDKEDSADDPGEQEIASSAGEDRIVFRNDTISLPLPTMWNRKKILGSLLSSNEKTPAVTLYLVGDRLDMALWAANAVVLYTYSCSASIPVWKFVLLLWIMNTILAFCCGIIERNDAAETRKSRKDDSSAAEVDRAKEQRVVQKKSVKKASEPLVVVEPERGAYDAIVGSTTLKLANPSDRKDGSICWMEVPPSDIALRSVGYGTTKKKVPSPGSLYECVAVDVLDSDKRIPDICSKVKLDSVLSSSGGEDLNATKTWISPEVFVISVSFPSEPPKLGWPTDDGMGLVLVAYFKMRDDTRAILRRVTGPDSDRSTEDLNVQKVNAVRLFEEWCKRSPADPTFQGRFKFIPTAVNTEEFGIPSYIMKYNGKPVLIKRAGVTGTLYNHPDAVSGGMMEFDVNLHAFPYLAKQAFSYMRDNFCSKVVGSMAFVIEGRNDSELPEVLIGGFKVFYPDPDCATRPSDFFRSSS